MSRKKLTASAVLTVLALVAGSLFSKKLRRHKDSDSNPDQDPASNSNLA
jgi:hypothetical protein